MLCVCVCCFGASIFKAHPRRLLGHPVSQGWGNDCAVQPGVYSSSIDLKIVDESRQAAIRISFVNVLNSAVHERISLFNWLVFFF